MTVRINSGPPSVPAARQRPSFRGVGEVVSAIKRLPDGNPLAGRQWGHRHRHGILDPTNKVASNNARALCVRGPGVRMECLQGSFRLMLFVTIVAFLISMGELALRADAGLPEHQFKELKALAHSQEHGTSSLEVIEGLGIGNQHYDLVFSNQEGAQTRLYHFEGFYIMLKFESLREDVLEEGEVQKRTDAKGWQVSEGSPVVIWDGLRKALRRHNFQIVQRDVDEDRAK